jgi:hypothetical protein
MRFLITKAMFTVLCTLWFVSAAFIRSVATGWIDEQYDASLSMLLDNIYENGTVIASPSRKDPDYYVSPIST